MSGILTPIYTSSPTINDMLYINGNANWFDRGEEYRFTLRMEDYPIRVVRVSRNCFNQVGANIPENVNYLAYFWIFPSSHSVSVWRLGNNDVIDMFTSTGISFNNVVYNIAILAKWGAENLNAYGVYEGEILYDTFEDFLLNEDVKILIKPTITYIPINCTLSGPTSVQAGDEITITVTPNEGYVFIGAQYVSLTTESDVETPEFTVDGNEISFIMPNGAVQVTVRCVKTNPYDEGGDSSINGGGGTFDNPDDVIDGPSLPSLSAIASGFIRMYNPTQAELTDFSTWLQDSSVFTAAFRDMFGKPIESVVSLAIAPFIPPRADEKDYVVISGTRSVGIQMYQVTRQYTEIDCGEITPKEYWGGFLDYAPFTKTSLYLPYVGYREINVNEIMEKPLKVFYHIDVFTGASVCFVMCGGNVLYHYDCNVLTNVPFGATEYNNFVSGVLNIAAQSATIAAAGTSGVGAAMIPSAATNIAASAANMVRPSFPHSGVVTANSGLLSIKTPYLILERPRQATPKDINHYTGFPSYVTSRLSDLSGYTKISDIHLENVPASDDELSEIETLLRNGVIL